MKFVCDGCQTHYYIGDQQIKRKRLRIRCRTCGNVMVILDANGTNTSIGAGPEEPRSSHVADQATSSGREETAAPSPAVASGIDSLDSDTEWYVSIDAELSGPLARGEVAKQIQAAGPDKTVLVWKQGMSAWKPPRQVAVIARELYLLYLALPQSPNDPPAAARPEAVESAAESPELATPGPLPETSSDIACADTDEAVNFLVTPPPVQELPPIGAKMPSPDSPPPCIVVEQAAERPAFPEIDFGPITPMALGERHPRIGYAVAVLAIVGLAILLGLVILRGQGAGIEVRCRDGATGTPGLGGGSDYGKFAYDFAGKHPGGSFEALLPFRPTCAAWDTCTDRSAYVGPSCGVSFTDAACNDLVVRKKGRRSEPTEGID